VSEYIELAKTNGTSALNKFTTDHSEPHATNIVQIENVTTTQIKLETRMWADAQRDGRPAKYR